MKNEERPYFMLKRLAKSAFAARIASFLIGAYIHFVHATSKWTITGLDHIETAAARGQGVIIAFWHGRLMMTPAMRRKTARRFFMLISAHRDGEIMANSVKSFGIEFIRGSAANPKKRQSNKGGVAASAEMLEALSHGHLIGVTPDGPRGPREKVNAGVIRIAQRAGAPVIPVAISVSRGKLLKTWDRFLFAWPFSRGALVIGTAIDPPGQNDTAMVETMRQSVENALSRVTRDADILTGLGVHRPHTTESTQ